MFFDLIVKGPGFAPIHIWELHADTARINLWVSQPIDTDFNLAFGCLRDRGDGSEHTIDMPMTQKV